MNFQEFLTRYQKLPVEHYPNTANEKPLVSVCVQTYQHVNFIKECLDGILMQETNFDFEILLGEDASTDGTREICIEYAEKYPDKIRLFLHRRENNISIGGSPTGRFNLVYNLFSAKGKYIALCEGDDYWTDPKKLQKQVDFLEENGDCVLCHHWQKLAKVKDNQYQEVEAPKEEHGYYPLKKAEVSNLFSNQLRIKTRTVLFRNVINPGDLLTEFPNAAFGDVPLSFLLGKKGKFGFIDEEMAVYRVTDTGVSKSGLKEVGSRKFVTNHFKNWIKIWDYANQHYNFEYNKESIITIKGFYKKMPLSPTEMIDLVRYNQFGRNSPFIQRTLMTFWLIFFFVKRSFNKITP